MPFNFLTPVERRWAALFCFIGSYIFINSFLNELKSDSQCYPWIQTTATLKELEYGGKRILPTAYLMWVPYTYEVAGTKYEGSYGSAYVPEPSVAVYLYGNKAVGSTVNIFFNPCEPKLSELSMPWPSHNAAGQAVALIAGLAFLLAGFSLLDWIPRKKLSPKS